MGHNAMRRIGAAAMIGLAVAAASPAGAEGLVFGGGAKSRLAQFRAQTAILDSRAAIQYEHSVRLTPHGKDGEGQDGPIPAWRGSYRGQYLQAAKAAAARHGVPEDLFLRLVQQESGWNPGAVSPKGATGLAQLMPETAAHLGVDINDPLQNLEGGARYLRMMYDRFGTWKLALAAYNAGPIAVDEHNGVPPYEETVAYVSAIAGG
jgi:soluble lytic murein transglycosylase-like protein